MSSTGANDHWDEFVAYDGLIAGRQERAFKALPAGPSRILDYGCFDGRFIGAVSVLRSDIECYGCDVNAEAVEQAQSRYTDVRFERVELSSRTPFPDGMFDCVCMLDVLEHVPDERLALDEIARIIKPGGRLVLSVPHAGPMAWLDPGNLKFRFPRIHRAFYRYVRRDRQGYKRRFEDAANGLFGDFSPREQMWHRHYSEQDLSALLNPKFVGIDVQRFGLFPPIWNLLMTSYSSVRRRPSLMLNGLLRLDVALNLGRYAYNIIVVTVKK